MIFIEWKSRPGLVSLFIEISFFNNKIELEMVNGIVNQTYSRQILVEYVSHYNIRYADILPGVSHEEERGHPEGEELKERE